jgi:hypothetical protein
MVCKGVHPEHCVLGSIAAVVGCTVGQILGIVISIQTAAVLSVNADYNSHDSPLI